jgi:nitrogen regulatory protein PII
MKQIEAVIKQFKLNAVKEALMPGETYFPIHYR